MGQYPSSYENTRRGKWCATEKHIYFIIDTYYGKINTSKRTLSIRHKKTSDEYYLCIDKVKHFNTSINDIIVAFNINKSSRDFKKTMEHFFNNNTMISLEATVVL